jgi:hypothetical protein
MLDPKTMSPTEREFIRVYVTAMQRDYDLIRSALHLMDPAQLGIRSVVEATKASQSLREMQAEFDSTLHALRNKHNFREKKMPPVPNLDDIADLFSLSFFKIIKTAASGQPKNDDGWFSGEPAEWGKTIKSALNINYNSLPKVLTTYLESLKKMLANDKTADIEKNDKPWTPPTIANKFAEYFEQALNAPEEDLEWYDEDDEDEFLDWFNGNDE